MRRRQTLYGEPAASACIPTANALPVLTPFARPRTLRGSPRGGGRTLLPLGSPPRAVTTTLSRRDAHARSEPRLMPARTLRGFSLSSPRRMVLPHSGIACRSPLFSPDGVDALGAAERAGRYYPRFGAERHRRAA
ncbi:hypothetical protein [Paramuribaculum intestinale]|uniref:hypothetical protein n=1 Tax=Paramuribaculum intestinale TaxID=2094151 RepID=UPI001056EDCD|nr:hypothetical protein [Paramuribaculum intestinale]